jgi:hypothetical protein
MTYTPFFFRRFQIDNAWRPVFIIVQEVDRGFADAFICSSG